MKNLITISLFLLTNSLFAQDTIKVKALNFQSVSRDTIVQFPAGNESYEKIIMAYGMRCKGARVSTGQNRNLGCGEWDYSCNTYIIDSTKIDSLSANTNKYIFNNSNATSLVYTDKNIYNYFHFKNIQTTVNQIVYEDIYTPHQTNGDTVRMLGTSEDNPAQKLIYMITAAELQQAQLSSGSIDGLILKVFNNITIENFQIRLKQLSNSSLAIENYTEDNFQQVYFNQTQFSQGANKLIFHTPFQWDGSSSVMVELIYHNSINQDDLLLEATSGMSFVSGKEKGIELLENSYIEIKEYKGVSGNQNRTIDAWVKTTLPNGEICGWGRDVSGEKWTFRTHSNGNLRVEVNGGYIIGSSNILDGKWHHVACVLEGNNVTDIRLYVDGQLENISESQGRAINTGNIVDLRISRGMNNRYLKGSIDKFRLWNRALSNSEIQEIMWSKQTNFDSDLELHLDFSNDLFNNKVVDLSGNERNGTIIGNFQEEWFYGMAQFRNFVQNKRPFTEIIRGDYNLTHSENIIEESLRHLPTWVDEITITSKAATIYTDEINFDRKMVWNAENLSYTYDENMQVIDSSFEESTGIFSQSEIDYWRRWPSHLEIMSFVTPYGINLDLGVNGKTWLFDVSDFAPILKNQKRIKLSRGGQNQEEMDIEFWFIKGTPPIEVKDINQVWLTEQIMPNYTQIQENIRFFAPVDFPISSDVNKVKIRSTITGHGQEGEFIPRNHQLHVGDTTFEWRVWKTCGDNPVYPQGGTWIYDRAGWCPGMATDLYEWDVTRFVKDGKLSLDYDITSGAGDSRYIMNKQVVTYGEINHNLDARISEITHPSNRVEYARTNPMCDNPKIVLQNVGKEKLTNVLITFWVNDGKIKKQHRWRGELNFMESVEIPLLYGFDIWSDAMEENNIFHVQIETVNGRKDDNPQNDVYASAFDLPIVVPEQCIVFFRTNNVAEQNTLTVTNINGDVVLKKENLTNNTIYRDTLSLVWGCYTLRLDDQGGNGINFWATPADGNGHLMITNMSGIPVHIANPDFGNFHQINFTANHRLSVNKTNSNNLKVYPNPSTQLFHIKGIDWTNSRIEIFDVSGRKVKVDMHKGTDKLSLDLSGQKSGIYFVEIKKDHEILRAKLIKT